MASTSSRTLRLLSLLQTHRHWSGLELADRLEVSLRTLRRDVDRLRDLGYPVQADRGVGGGYQLAPGASLPPLVLDDEEAVALAVGLLAGAGGSLSGIAEASVRALAKVVQVMPQRLRHRVEALRSATASPQWQDALADGPPAADPAALVVLAQACRDDERVTFGYQSADGTPSERRVEPRQLVSAGRRWYLLGYDLTRGDWRIFRLDRVTQPTGSGARFRHRDVPGGDPADYVRRRLERADELRPVTAVVRAEAADIRRRLGRWVRATDLGAGGCRLEFDAAGLEWAAFALGVCGADIIAVQPPELADLLADWGGRFSRSELIGTAEQHQ